MEVERRIAGDGDLEDITEKESSSFHAIIVQSSDQMNRFALMIL
jgi:hypothetical protein